MLDRFYFNNRNCFSDMNILVKNTIEFPLTTEDTISDIVDGRSGSLTTKKGTYKDKEITLTLSLLATNEDLWQLVEDMDEWFSNIKDNRLIFSDRQNRAYRVKYVRYEKLKDELFIMGETQITFVCEPFLTEINETTIDVTNSNSIFYNGNVESEPLIEIWGSGNIQITVNDHNFIVKNVVNYCKVDSNLLNALDQNKLPLETQGNFPTLEKGNNTITTLGTINKITINPRTSFKN